MLFLSFGGDDLALKRLSAAQHARNSVHIPHPQVGELAHQTQGVGIFAIGEYPCRHAPLVGAFCFGDDLALKRLSAAHRAGRFGFNPY